MKRQIVATVVAVAIIVPFLINLLGWNLFLYLHLEEKDLIAACSRGISHIALSESWEGSLAFGIELPELFGAREYHFGPFHLLLERRLDPMTPFSFSASLDDKTYRTVEFPWLLLLLIPIFLVGRREVGGH